MGAPLNQWGSCDSNLCKSRYQCEAQSILPPSGRERLIVGDRRAQAVIQQTHFETYAEYQAFHKGFAAAIEHLKALTFHMRHSLEGHGKQDEAELVSNMLETAAKSMQGDVGFTQCQRSECRAYQQTLLEIAEAEGAAYRKADEQQSEQGENAPDVEAVIEERLEGERWRWMGELVQGLERHHELESLQWSADYQQAFRWIRHLEPQLQAIADKHRVSLGYVTEFAQKHFRGKVGQARKDVVADVEALIETHPLWGLWSPYGRPTFLPGEPVTVEITDSIAPDEDTRFARYRFEDGKELPIQEELDAVSSEISDEVRVTVTVTLQTGDLVIQSTMKQADQVEQARKYEEWKKQGSDFDKLPESLPSCRTYYVLAPDGELVRVVSSRDSEENAAENSVLEYFQGELALPELLTRIRNWETAG